jgi:hypothetical protein
MRLSTRAGRDDERSVAVIRAALDAGASLPTRRTPIAWTTATSDTTNASSPAPRGWSGDRSRVIVATKGNASPKSAWVPDGRAKHLRDACDASRRALGVETIDLYQLHAVDPRTPIDTSVRALARLQDEGRSATLASATSPFTRFKRRNRSSRSPRQVSLSPFDDESFETASPNTAGTMAFG